MSRGSDAFTLLARALLVDGYRNGCLVDFTASESKRWSSVTFNGMQHRLVLSGQPAAAFESWIASLPEAEFTLRGHLVADLVVERVSREGDTMTAELEVLTVEAR